MMLVLPDGRRLEAAAWGPDSGPAILLLHEGLGSVSLWRDFPERLATATGLGVLAYSRPGHGRSDGTPLPRPLRYLHAEACDILPRVLDALGRDRVLLVGHSDGGSIAAIHAGCCRDRRVAGIAMLAPHVFVEQLSLDGIAATLRRWDAGTLRPRLARHHADPDTVFLGWSGAWLDPAFPGVFDLAAEIARIAVPMLVVQGEADPYGSVAQVRFLERAARRPVEALIMPGIGHAPHQDAPETVLDTLSDFAARAFAA